MILWYTSRRAAREGRSVGPPRLAVGGSVGSGAGRSVGSRAERPSPADQRSERQSGRERVGRSGRPDKRSSKRWESRFRSFQSGRSGSVGPRVGRLGQTTATAHRHGRSVGATRPHLRGPGAMRVGRSVRPDVTYEAPAASDPGRSVGAPRVGTGRAREAGSVGRGRIPQNQLRTPLSADRSATGIKSLSQSHSTRSLTTDHSDGRFK